jgi:hypothetical protein
MMSTLGRTGNVVVTNSEGTHARRTDIERLINRGKMDMVKEEVT